MAIQGTLNRAAAAPVLEVQSITEISRSYLIAKRAIDIIFSLLILIPLCLLTLVMIVIIPLDSPGRVIYRQKRVGRNGKEFDFFKFRSMVEDADTSEHRMRFKQFATGEDDRLDYMAWRAKDNRITRVGKFIRKTSLDELPQFWNVLLGQMTLVGPRPPISYEVENYTAHDWLRLSAKPGITGPYQVYARAQVPFKEMVDMDISYLQRQSIREDLKLIFLTVPVMLSGKGGN